MKPHLKPTLLALACFAGAVCQLSAQTTVYWSADGLAKGGTGTWDTGTGHFGPSGGPFTIIWNNTLNASDTVVFEGTAGNVALDASVTHARRFNINSSGYVIGAGALTSNQASNSFVVQSLQKFTATVDTSFNLTATGNANLRIRTEHAGNDAVLNIGGDYTFTDTSSIKKLDLESNSDLYTHTINFTGRLLDTAGPSVRLRIGFSGGANSTFNLHGASTNNGGTEISSGTVYLHNDSALGAASGQALIGDDNTLDATIRLLTVGPRVIANRINMSKGNGLRIIGGSTADVSEFSNNVDINVDTGINQLTAAAGGKVIFSGIINDGSGTRGIEKVGDGTVVIAGASAYEGPTTVRVGTLLADNSFRAIGVGAVTVKAGAALGGIGMIEGATTVEDGGKLTFTAATPAASHDKLLISNTLTFSGASTVDIVAGAAPGTGVYTLLTATGGITGPVPALGSKPAGWTADPPYLSGDGLSLLINITSTGAVVEPPVPALSTALAGGNLQISCPGVTGFRYQLEESTTSDLAGWAAVAGQVADGLTGSDITFTVPVPAAGGRDFYRVVVSPVP